MDEHFKIVFQEITAILKENGFKKSGRTFNKAFSSDTIQVVSIQLGERSMQGLFTINFGVYTSENSSSAKFIPIYSCQARQRIGFISGQKDIWWSQSNLSNAEQASILQKLKKGVDWLDKISFSPKKTPPVLVSAKSKES